MVKDKFELRYLSKDFYNEYPQEEFKEMIQKESRPFLVLLIKIKDLTFAVPFRSNVRHDYCYKFKNSTRYTETSTALDFSKAIIIKDEKYLENAASIDKKEYIELNSKFYFIFHKFEKFVYKYIQVITKLPKNSYEYKRMSFCTLQYFHKELGIEEYKKEQ